MRCVRFAMLLNIVFVARVSCFAVHPTGVSDTSLLRTPHAISIFFAPRQRLLLGVTKTALSATPADSLGPAEKVQRSLDRDAGVGRAESLRNTVSKLIELRRRGLKYDGTPLSEDAKAADAAKLMEKMMREAEDFLGP